MKAGPPQGAGPELTAPREPSGSTVGLHWAGRELSRAPPSTLVGSTVSQMGRLGV